MVAPEEVHSYASEELSRLGLWQQGWRIKWNRHATTAGLCEYAPRTITFSGPAMERYSWPVVQQLVRHEMAHALVGYDDDHGALWKKTIRELGGVPEKHCPEFSTEVEQVRYSFTNPSPQNLGTFALIILAALIAAPPVGLALVLAAAVGAVAYSLKKDKPVLAPDTIEMIERDIR